MTLRVLPGMCAAAVAILAASPSYAQAPGAGAAERRDGGHVAVRTGARDSDARADELLAKMTPEERQSLLHGVMPILVPMSKRPADMVMGAGYVPGVPRLGIPPLTETDASLGVSNLGNMRKGDVATALPSGLAIASSWDPALAERGGAMIGSEARAKGFNVMLAGGVNLTREPRNGRNFEYLGEDPLLAGVLAGHSIRGVQSNRIVSTIKHFALNAQETGRNSLDVRIGEAVMRESDLLAFEIANGIGRPGSVMCAYNQVNGAFSCENEFLLDTVLRKDWGFKGWVMSDWGAVHSTEALVKGLDQQSGEQIDAKRFFGAPLTDAVAAGRIPASAFDTAARRILRTMAEHGLLDAPATPGGAIDYDAHAAIAQETAEAGMVLLKNEGRILPLARTARRIAVIGGHADIGVLSGSGSSQVRPVGGPALEVKRTDVGAASSFAMMTYYPSSPLKALRAALPAASISYDDGTDVARAARVARDADLVVLFAEQWATEGFDVPDLDLPDNQNALISAVADANARTVVVLETGGPVLMPWLAKVPAVVEAWYPGQRGGEAIARVLTGDVNPSGHLPMTFPASIDQTPNPKLPGSEAARATAADRAVYGLLAMTKPFEVRYPEGADVGYRWYQRRQQTPLFAFGHGLSYSSFRYGGLKLGGGRSMRVTFDVTNAGDRAGATVAQVYAQGSGQQARRLVGWQRVALKPGETRRVTVEADMRPLARFDEKARRWAVDAGAYRVQVGGSSAEPALGGTTRLAASTRRP